MTFASCYLSEILEMHDHGAKSEYSQNFPKQINRLKPDVSVHAVRWKLQNDVPLEKK